MTQNLHLIQRLQNLIELEEKAKSLSGTQFYYNDSSWAGWRIFNSEGIETSVCLICAISDGGFLIREIDWTLDRGGVDHFDANGTFLKSFRSKDPIPLQLLIPGLSAFQFSNGSVLKHFLLTLLQHQTELAASGSAKGSLIAGLIQIIKSTLEPSDLRKTLKLIKDTAFSNELDEGLTFEEKEILRHKLMAYQLALWRLYRRIWPGKISRWSRLNLLGTHLSSLLYGWRVVPFQRFRGISYKYTIGLFLWFFKTVKGNIGYSIALAIYGPFTFFFITQPMNPHAMWAVGKVRGSYIGVVDRIEHALDFAFKVPTAKAPSDGLLAQKKQWLVDHKIFYPAMPMVADLPALDLQTWSERMSNFKAMQIGYEENLQIAARMGRLEQMETQLNFALIAESAWREIDRYQAEISTALRGIPQSKPALRNYLLQEKERIKQIKLYLWDRLIRYMLDHPYIVLNESGDQQKVDYYMGRSFIFLSEITENLIREYQGLKKPLGFHQIEKLASIYRNQFVSADTLNLRLKQNSILGKLSNPRDSLELRSLLKRQWEILYLLQTRAQEAATFSLQMYTWSVRNAIWVMQSLYSIKRDELRCWVSEPCSQTVALEAQALTESLYHILSVEYVSIRQEIGNRLDLDLESVQRELLLDSIEKSFDERELVLHERH